MTHLETEINAQPDVIQQFLAAQQTTIDAVAAALRDFDPVFALIAARGTSDNAARYAQYLFGIQAQLPVALATPSVHTLYAAQPKLSRAVVIGISQSGRSPDVRQVVADGKAQGALTIAITNDPESPLAKLAEHTIDLSAGLEQSVAATKTYTASLVAIAALVQSYRQDAARQAELAQLPEFVRHTLDANQHILEWVQRYRYTERLAVIGRGYNYCTAYEISLKVKELCYITAEEYSEADFRHGPIAIVASGFPVIVIAPVGETHLLMRDLLEKLRERGAECLVISNDADAITAAKYAMLLPQNLPEWLSPVCAVLPGQIFAHRLAEARGHNVDEPRGLSKVTSTR